MAFAGGYPYAPAALNDVKVTGGFWLARIETNRLVTVKTDFRKCEETGRIANFEKAARREKGGFKGVPWDDSDVYKVIEGAAYTLAQHPDAELDRYLDNLIAQIAGAKQQHGEQTGFFKNEVASEINEEITSSSKPQKKTDNLCKS